MAALFANVATLLFDYLQMAPEVNQCASLFVHIISAALPVPCWKS
ncbi:hypothetical protein [Pseudoduganella sp. RAF53_2]